MQLIKSFKPFNLNFNDLNLDPGLMEGITSMGFEKPTPVQEKAIPEILEGKDLLGFAQTGTGKTAAFLIPLINFIAGSGDENSIKAMIIVPTRELALQIDQQMQGLAYFTGVSSIAIYGGGDGTSFVQEKTALSKGANVIICTPGKIIAHFVHDYVKIGNLKYLVLDEADRMLDMGFYEDIMKIISNLPGKRQNLMFAATMPDNIRKLANNVLNDPVEVKIALSKPVEKILQAAYSIYDNQKIPLLKDLVRHEELKRVLVFCSTKSGTKTLARELKKSGLPAEEIHSDLEQREREKVLNAFKSKQVKILVATDVVSRGIDIEDIDLVINYDVPNDSEDYIHRIGRTARAEADGIAITFISPREQSQFARIEKFLGKPVNKPPLPTELGKGPEYNPVSKPHFRDRKHKGRKRK